MIVNTSSIIARLATSHTFAPAAPHLGPVWDKSRFFFTFPYEKEPYGVLQKIGTLTHFFASLSPSDL
jgi:hypothetical protein